MVTFGNQESSPSQFFLAHIVFDEEHGPVLKNYLAHELEIPKIILQGVTTTLFTMAVGVGEPTGEPDTAIIPINVTGIQGRVLIHSFSVEDPRARGKNRIESFMLFTPRAHQDKLLQHSLALSNILQDAIRDIKVIQNGSSNSFSLKKIFENIKKILLTKIDNKVQNLISEICTDKETVIVSDGTIRAVHNIVLLPDIISLVNQIPLLLHDYIEELKAYGTFFDALPIEIHGRTYGNQQFYLMAIENNFILAFSSGKGRLGSLFRIFREILWDLNIKSALRSQSYISRYSTNIEDVSERFPRVQYLDDSFVLLKSYSPVITDGTLIRCTNDLKKIEAIRISSKKVISKHAFVCRIFTVVNQLSLHIFRTRLIQLVFSQHGSNTIALMWATNSSKDVSLFMVGDSTRGVGLLKLVSEQILEHQGSSEFPKV